MPVRRDKDTGETVEVPSELVKPGKQGHLRADSTDEHPMDPRDRNIGPGNQAPVRGKRATEAPTVPVHRLGALHGATHGAGAAARAGRPGVTSLDDPTVPIRSGSGEVASSRPEAGEEQTRLLRLRRSGADPALAGSGVDDPMADPVVGWLVVTAGPGKGRTVPLGYGVNSLGRGGEVRVKLDFGDDQISRQGHATVTYDPRGRQFYLQHGGGKNLTYLEDQPVLVPTALEAMQEFSIGVTMLRFVPLCGPEFDWQDTGDG